MSGNPAWRHLFACDQPSTVLLLITHHSSLVEGHAGEAHALESAWMNVLSVVQQLAAAGPERFEHGVCRRQAADTAAIGFLADDAEVARQVHRLRLPHQG